ncbi:TRAFAC clade GTPase domain-containing protein [Nostoc sp. UHCC 0252]|uniref:TRAFAC clade GTPase domain-containing protein n=1 Tax=Nostoc sp. UHCC 0252 TaxID=3110241 RepID=UPI002B20D6AA|nr:hypothetical protein [Nostoc sp. UHCC 0252]MEA5604806.1 hypothetical protein [Nostoc sp. UHCC 0252]
MTTSQHSNSQTSKNQIRMGVWGTTGAGKTTYLMRLFHALANSDSWDVAVDDKTKTFITMHSEKMSKGYFPEPTRVRGKELDIYSYRLTYKGAGSRTKILFEFIDAPGEFYEEIGNAKGKVAETNQQSKDIVDYLLSCHGIIFLLDPTRENEDGKTYEVLLQDVFMEMQKRQAELNPDKEDKLEQYVAFAVTKADLKKIWEKGMNSFGLVKELLNINLSLGWFENYVWLDQNQLRLVRGNYPSAGKNHRCQFFSISAIGVYKDEHGNWESPISDTNESDGGILEQTDNPQANTTSVFGGIPNYHPARTKTEYRFRHDVRLVQFGVIEPLEWLIDGILTHPPSL